MVRPLKEDELKRRLSALDEGFAAQALPHKCRAMQAFKDIYGNVPDGPVRTNLFDPIAHWFIKRYGQRAYWDAVIGRIPVLWRGSVYVVLIPFVVGDTAVNLGQQVEGLPPDLAADFNAELLGTTGRQVAGATMSFQALYNLIVDDSFLDEVQRALVWRGVFDLENSANSLRHVGDTQNAIFHAHAAAEKFLKVALTRAGSKDDLQALGHRLPQIFDKLAVLDDRFAWLKPSVDKLHALAPNMRIRYDIVPRTIEDAITGFNAAVGISGPLARTWLFDIQRGTSNSSFAEGKVYLDGTGAVCFCKRLIQTPGQESSALILRMIEIPKIGQTIVLETPVALNVSGLYLEVTDERRAAAMRLKLEYHMAHGERRRPEDLGVEIASGAEGSHTTAMLRMPVQAGDAAKKSKSRK